MVSRRYELPEEQWNKIKHYFDGKKSRPYKNVRNTAHGMLSVDVFVNGKGQGFLKRFLRI